MTYQMNEFASDIDSNLDQDFIARNRMTKKKKIDGA